MTDLLPVAILFGVTIAGALIIATIAEHIAYRRQQSLIREMWDEAERVVHRVECPWNLR